MGYQSDTNHERCALRALGSFTSSASCSAWSLKPKYFEPIAAMTAIYALCSAVRLFFYVPQILAVARERSAAHAISLISWIFWTVSHAATAVYGYVVANDALLSWMMWGNTLGCLGIVALTTLKRRRYGWTRRAMNQSQSVVRT